MSDTRMIEPRWSEPDTWSDPHRHADVDSPDRAAWIIQLTRTDGEQARIILYDDGTGGVGVTIGGSSGADITVSEDGTSTAPLAVNLRLLSPAGTDWNDRKRIAEALVASGGWETYGPGSNIEVYDRHDGTEIVTEYAEFTSRLVYASIRQSGHGESQRLLGEGKFDRVLAAIAS
jgi:hypothetical protein